MADSDATSHMTNHASKISNLIPYNVNDGILIGDGNCLQISHTGNIKIKIENESLKLNNILVVPKLKKNLLSKAK